MQISADGWILFEQIHFIPSSLQILRWKLEFHLFNVFTALTISKYIHYTLLLIQRIIIADFATHTLVIFMVNSYVSQKVVNSSRKDIY